LRPILRFLVCVLITRISFTKSNIQKQESNYQKNSSNLSGIKDFNNVHVSNFSSILTETSKHNVPDKIYFVNNQKRLEPEIKLGVIKTVANQAADISINRPDRHLSQGF